MKKSAFTNIKTLIWDWNGTLINDVGYAVSCMNLLLAKRNLPILTIDKYKSIFTFPVIEYYKKAGFDFDNEPWEVVGYEFMQHYWANFHKISLYSDVERVLSSFRGAGYKQLILSAMEQNKLKEHVEAHNISAFFDNVKGIDDHYADGKVGAGEHLLNGITEKPSDICIIGDTPHDYEVAESLGVSCVLIAHGHSNATRLKKVCGAVVEDLNELKHLFMS